MKLNVPAPELKSLNVNSLVKNGGFTCVECSLDDFVLHEVKYFYEVVKAEDSGYDDDMLDSLNLDHPLSALYPSENNKKVEVLRKMTKKKETVMPSNSIVISEVNSDQPFSPINPKLLEKSQPLAKTELYRYSSRQMNKF